MYPRRNSQIDPKTMTKNNKAPLRKPAVGSRLPMELRAPSQLRRMFH